MGRVCPWWLGYVLTNPVRRLLHDPEKILRPFVCEGMTAVDIGCGMGYFSIPMARLAGGTGRVVCVDLQERMLAALRKRARRAGVLERMEVVQASPHSLNLNQREGTADFVLAFAVVHEIPDQARIFSEIRTVLKSGGTALFSEPAGHVRRREFEAAVSSAQAQGLAVHPAARISREHSVVLTK